MKILVSGGHLTPALAFIDYVQTHHPETELVFVGRLFSQDKLKQKSQEKTEVKRRGITFIPLAAPRLSNRSILEKVLVVAQLVGTFFQACQILLKEKPRVFLSFGSYVAVPLAVASYVLRIPIVTHEQTRAVGESTKFLARLAKAVALTHDSSRAHVSHKKLVTTGNPLRPQLLTKQAQPAWMMRSPVKPLLYITGGNQGSEVINSTIKRMVKTLVKHWQVIHQCGAVTANRNYLQELRQIKTELPQTHQDDYIIKEWITDQELSWIYQHATLVIARAGANTVMELTTLKVPSILIPLPFAHFDEQTLNARYLADEGGAILLPQKDLTPESLLNAITYAKRHSRSLKTKLKALTPPLEGSPQLYQLLTDVIS